MDIAHLASANKTIGAKQTIKSIAKGSVKFVFLGCDSDSCVVDPVRMACVEHNIPFDDKHTMDDPVNDEHTMDDLGRVCRIKVRATAVGVLR